MHEQYLRRAIQLALENVEAGGGPFGAVIVQSGHIIAEGVNLVTSINDPTAHAEIVAIRAACSALNTFQLDACDVYASCEPCPMCVGAIYWSRPRALYFAASRQEAAAAGFDDQLIYEELTLPPNNRTIPTLRVPVLEAGAPFEAWLQKADRTPY